MKLYVKFYINPSFGLFFVLQVAVKFVTKTENVVYISIVSRPCSVFSQLLFSVSHLLY